MLLDRFIKYVKIDTMSGKEKTKTPSTQKQFNLAHVLIDELKELGLEDIKLTDDCILTATLKANTNESDDTIGFFAHLDTIPDVSGTNVNPQIVKNYDGNPIHLKNNITLDTVQFPFMKNLVGKTLITTDGTTILGADDKAGIANIMTMLEFFVNNPDVKHTTIKVGFSADEEIGGGLDDFDVKAFNADYAYTIDGGSYNELNYECFNAASVKIHIDGLDIHPGSAKDKMINAALIATEFEMMLPAYQKPMYTEGYEGFNHLCYINGCVGYADMEYILRNHDLAQLQLQKENFILVKDFLNKKYGDVVKLTITDGYLNMAEYIKKDPRSINRAIDRMKRLGITPDITPIRGGTDGAKLTLMGLNTPNLGTGGYNCHGQYEFACLEEMQKVVDILIEIAKVY